MKTLVKFGIIYATDPLLQNKTEIVCLRRFTFDIREVKHDVTSNGKNETFADCFQLFVR